MTVPFNVNAIPRDQFLTNAILWVDNVIVNRMSSDVAAIDVLLELTDLVLRAV